MGTHLKFCFYNFFIFCCLIYYCNRWRHAECDYSNKQTYWMILLYNGYISLQIIMFVDVAQSLNQMLSLIKCMVRAIILVLNRSVISVVYYI